MIAQNNKQAVVNQNGKPRTAGYKSIPHIWFNQPRDLPAFSFATIRAMLIDPGVRLNLATRAAPIAGAQFAFKGDGDKWVEGLQCDDPVIGAFIYKQLIHIWRNFLPAIMRAQIWGWSAGEVTLTLGATGLVEIDKLEPRHAGDCQLLKVDHQRWGIRVDRVEGKGAIQLPFPYCWFHSYCAEDGQDYGTSILLGAYSPWADKWFNGAALDVRRLFMHKDAYGGADITYPEGTTWVDGVNEPVPNVDIARQITEQLLSGGITQRPSARDENGNEKWVLTRATVPANPTHILQYPKDLDEEIRRGMEIPDDVVSSDAGAWAGKRVTIASFYASLDHGIVQMLADFKEQLFNPLCMLNFGKVPDYEIRHKPLAEQAMEQQSNAGPGGGPQQGPQGGGGGPGFPQDRPMMPQSTQPMQRMSLTAEEQLVSGELTLSELMDVSRRAIRMNVTDASGHEHKGKGEGGGQFTSGAGSGRPKKKLTSTELDDVPVGDLVSIDGTPYKHLGNKQWEALFETRQDRSKYRTTAFLQSYVESFPGDIVHVPADRDSESKHHDSEHAFSSKEQDQPTTKSPIKTTREKRQDKQKPQDLERKLNDHAETARQWLKTNVHGDPNPYQMESAASYVYFNRFDSNDKKAFKNRKQFVKDIVALLSHDQPIKMASTHAPAGGVTVAGQEFKGGEFIPGEVMAKASSDEKKQLTGKVKSPPKPKVSFEEKAAKATAHFDKLMESKTPEDAKAFRAAKADGIAIPPAWTSVTYHGKDKDIIAEGRDAKGRKQRTENPAYRKGISDKNNARITKDLAPKIDKLRVQLKQDAIAGNEESKVLYLISQTGFRIGGKGDGKAEEQAFGASTLTGDHVAVDGNTVKFNFPGKKGVKQSHSITDPVIADMFRSAKSGEPVFKTRDTKVRAAWQDKYGGEKVHDIRHVVAAEVAKREISNRIPPNPKNERERQKLILAIATEAAKKLGNNPSEALGTYIDPAIWQSVKVG